MKYKVSLLLVVGMMFSASSVFALVNFSTLTNIQGGVAYEEKLWEDENSTQPSKEDQIRSLKSYDLANKLLQEGTAAIFYIAPHNPNHKTDTRNKPKTFTDVSALRTKMTGQSVQIVDSLKGGYTFDNASVSFSPITNVNPPTPEEAAAMAEKLRKQAEESNKEYAMMPVKLSDDHWTILSTYKQGKNRINVSISRSDGKETVIVHQDWNLKQEQIVVKGTTLLYTEFDGGKNIRWIYDVPNSTHTIQYAIETGEGISKEELIKIAETYLG